MRKRLFSLCMALALCLGLLPATAWAADDETVTYGTIEVGGKELTNSEGTPVVYATTDETAGTVTTEGATAENYNVMWDGTTLTLRNATIKEAVEYTDKSNEKIAIYLASGDLALALVGKNTVDALGDGSAASYGINLGGSLTISGQEGASLSVFGGPTTSGNSCGIYASGAITMESGIVTVTGESASAASYGICASGAVTIENGTVNAASGQAKGDSIGIYTSNSVTIEDGTVNATAGYVDGSGNYYSCGIRARGDITINDGTVIATGGEATGSSNYSSGYYFSNGIRGESNITINGGNVTATGGKVTGTGSQRYSMGLYAANAITIHGGSVTGKSGETETYPDYSDGIAASGSITITGGTVTGEGNKSNNTAGIHVLSGCTLTISGGVVKGIGGPGRTLSYGIRAGTIQIEAGTVTGTGGDSNGKYSLGIFADSGDMIISGGDVTGKSGTGALSCGIATNTKLEIKSATVKAEGGTALTSCGFYAAETCSIEDSTVTATGGTAEQENSSGIFAGDTTSAQVIQVTIKNATVTATGGTATNGDSSGISATNTIADVKVTIEDATVTTTGGTAGTGSYGILAETNDTDKSAEVTINGNSVVRANMTGEEDVDGEPISGETIKQENSIVFENGVGTVYGKVTLQEDLTVDAGESLTIPQDATLLIPENVTLTNRGTMTNNGTINNQGTLTIEPGGGLAGSGTVTGNSVEWPYTPPPANPNYRIDVTTTEGGTVTKDPAAAKAGETVTLTPTPDAGYEVGDVTVTDRFGDAVEVTENPDGTYTFTMPNGQVSVNVTFVEVQPEPLPFTDVAESDWFHDAVRYVYENGLMDGVGDNLFAPNSQTTRAQLVTILHRLEGEPAVTGQSAFTDVEADTWYTAAVTWAAANGIVNGISETQFAPGNNITREQLATILYRYAQAKGYDVSASADLSGFPDAGDIQSYATQALSWAVAEGLLQGFEDDTLRPQGNATRAQIATILMRFCQTVAE